MDPENAYQSSGTGGNGLGGILGSRFKLIAGLFGLAVLMIGGVLLIQSLRFHIVKTDPPMNKVGSSSANITIYFNEELNPKSLDLALDFDTKTSHKVTGKTIVIKLEEPLTVSREYTITIKSVSSTDGSKITDKTLRFVAQDIPFEQLPESQQKALIKEQNETPKPAPAQLDFQGTNELLNQGLSTEQIEGYKQAVVKYAESAGKAFQAAALDPATFVTGPDQSGNGTFVATFTLALDQIKFNARLDYFGLSEVRLYLYDPASNAQLFDSQTIDVTRP